MSAAADFALAEWQAFKSSATVKALVAIETAAVVALVQQAIAGQVPLTFDGLKGWAIGQAAVVVALLLRRAIAGVEAQLGGAVDPITVRRIEDNALGALLSRVAEKDQGLARGIAEHMQDVDPDATPRPKEIR